MADDGVNELIANFIGVTGADEERARFYLGAANWDLNAAITTFFDSDENDEPAIQTDSSQVDRSVTVGNNDDDSGGANVVDKSYRQPKATKSNITTLSSYQKNQSDSDGEEGQAFYAGGSETSGQQIIGPNKKKKDLTQSVFDAAKTHGAEVISEEPPQRSSKKVNAFKGAGFTLGSNVDASKQVGASLSKDEVRNQEPQTTVIKFWQNGFSVDDGPLRDPNDPANSEFMDSIKRGEVPNELRQHAHGGEVHVNMEDHRNEDFVVPKQKIKFFTGAGHTLGSPVPNVVEEASLAPLAAVSSVPSQPTFKLDESQPVTSIQIRLADGTRLVSKFNMHNTVGDIRNVVRSAKPGQGNFNLMTTFPNKILSNDSETIESAKLKNASIVQRMV